jgi:hypothetical protein
MEIIRVTPKFIEIILPISNLKKISLCGFKQQPNGSFKRGTQTIVPINENQIFIRSNSNDNLGHLITNLSQGAFH